MSDIGSIYAEVKQLRADVFELQRARRNANQQGGAAAANDATIGVWRKFTPYLWQNPDYITPQSGTNPLGAYCFIAPGLMHVLIEFAVEEPNYPTVTSAGGALGSAIGFFPPDGFYMLGGAEIDYNFSVYAGGSYTYERFISGGPPAVWESYTGTVLVDFGFMWLTDWEQGTSAYEHLGDRWTVNEVDRIRVNCILPYVVADPSVTWGP